MALEEQEAEEIRRILLTLTEAFRSRALDVQRTIEVATELDVCRPKPGSLNSSMVFEPAVASDGRMELRGARIRS